VIEAAIYAFVLLLSLFLAAQAVFTLVLMLHMWERPERLEESDSPHIYVPPKLSFTAILPARHEEGVIRETIRKVWETDYPKRLLEVVVVCERSDLGTIAEAEQAAREIGHSNVRVVTFGGGPINKPHGLNVALRETTNEVVTIFDAEDDVHPELFYVINTIMRKKGASIVQAGVQLMNYGSSWYSIHNVLEYFFWFKSRLHFHAKVGMIPLGGNTVFIKRRLIEDVGGWDEGCLTEDADIGIRLSVLGERIVVTYDAGHATREETPHSVGGFIKQRTRWCQGFFQILRKGDWRKLPTRGQRLLAFYTLTYPFFQALVGALWLPAVAMMLYLKVPIGVAIVSLLPLYAVGFQFLVSLAGLFDFARAYKFSLGGRDFTRLALGFLPYQFLLSISALRAVLREYRGATNWEKTAHSGVHRASTEKKIFYPAYPGASRLPANEKTLFPGVRPADVVFRIGLDTLFREAVDHLNVERGSVMVFDPQRNAFSIKASRGLPEHIVRLANVGVGGGVAGWVAQNKWPVVVEGQQAPRELRDRLTQPDLLSSIVLPIERDGETAAVISLSSKEKKLGDEDLRWLNDRAKELLNMEPNVLLT
jgi:glycosyltransferase XagB